MKSEFRVCLQYADFPVPGYDSVVTRIRDPCQLMCAAYKFVPGDIVKIVCVTAENSSISVCKTGRRFSEGSPDRRKPVSLSAH